MSESLIKGGGEGLSVTTVFQLLDPSVIYGATSFRYDLYLKAGVGGQGVWQEDSDGAGDWADISVAHVLVEGDENFDVGVPVLPITGGSFRVLVEAGELDYWYALNSGAGKFPTTRGVQGSSSSTVEFFVEAGRVYTIVSDGTHAWNYAADVNGATWTPFAEGATNGFTFDSPSTGRIQLVPTGAVNFVITSRSAI